MDNLEHQARHLWEFVLGGGQGTDRRWEELTEQERRNIIRFTEVLTEELASKKPANGTD